MHIYNWIFALFTKYRYMFPRSVRHLIEKRHLILPEDGAVNADTCSRYLVNNAKYSIMHVHLWTQ